MSIAQEDGVVSQSNGNKDMRGFILSFMHARHIFHHKVPINIVVPFNHHIFNPVRDMQIQHRHTERNGDTLELKFLNIDFFSPNNVKC